MATEQMKINSNSISGALLRCQQHGNLYENPEWTHNYLRIGIREAASSDAPRRYCDQRRPQSVLAASICHGLDWKGCMPLCHCWQGGNSWLPYCWQWEKEFT
jgi:hypothetical protein